MKTKIFSLLTMISALFLGTSCTEDMEYKDVDITPVSQLYSPKDNQSVQLLASATASLFFEWSSSLAADGNAPQYEVVFDKVDGDFSNPIYRQTSDDLGTRNYATISHKVLDKVAQMAGIANGETGTVKWTVVSSRGIVSKTSSLSRTLNITRLLGFSEIPAQVFITGEGTECGTEVASAIAMSSPASGEYEIFTKLEAGKAYKFIDNKTGSFRTFYIDGASLKESNDGEGSATVSETGVYRIVLDFNVAAVTMQKVESVGWYFCPDGKVDVYLDYVGNGTWVGQGQTPFHQESWGRDERYKFEMVLSKDGNETVEHWGPTNKTDSRPGDNQGEEYFYMSEYGVSQWDDKWKLHGKFDSENNGGKDTKFTFILNASGHYTHKVELVD